jgi:DNA polymerase III alpha subunit
LTFQTAAGKTAFSNVSKIMSGKYGKYKKEVKADRLKSQNELNKLLQMDNSEARRIQDMIDSNRKIKDQLNPDAVDPDGNSLYNAELHEISKLSAYKELFEIMQKIEGTVTSTGSHTGDVIKTREPLWKYTARTNNGKYPDYSIMLTTSY